MSKTAMNLQTPTSPGAAKPSCTAKESSDYFINTSDEMEALERAAADGQYGYHYWVDGPEKCLFHEIPGASHYICLPTLIQDESRCTTLSVVRELAGKQDCDAALAFLYIANLLARPGAHPNQSARRGIIKLDDVIRKIGWHPRSALDRRDMLRKIYGYILFGERAYLIRRLPTIVRDPRSGIFTGAEVRGPIWKITREDQQCHPLPAQEAPTRLELLLSPCWHELLLEGQINQFLPTGEVLGSIFGCKPSGAWARAVGLALASFWRRHHTSVLATGIGLKPTRRYLLECYPPKTGTADSVLHGAKPLRAIEHWTSAVSILVEKGLVEKSGEALLTLQAQKSKLPRQGWAEAWLNERADLMPGPLLCDAIWSHSFQLPPTQGPKRRGRPRRDA